MIKHPFKYRAVIRWLRIIGAYGEIAALRQALG